MKAIEIQEDAMPNTIEVINCNHGGFYSVNEHGDNGLVNLGQVQRLSAREWAARTHGNYRDSNPPVFKTRRDAVDYLTHAPRFA